MARLISRARLRALRRRFRNTSWATWPTFADADWITSIGLCDLGRTYWLTGAFDRAEAALREASTIAGERLTPHIQALLTLHQCQLYLYNAQ